MIKKCKITNIMNGVILGVTKEPIKNGAIRDLNSGQIMACMLSGSVDEILSDGTLVRLNRSNYASNNDIKKIHIEDETFVDESLNIDNSTPQIPVNGKNEEVPANETSNKPEEVNNNQAATQVPVDEKNEEVPVNETLNKPENVDNNQSVSTQETENKKETKPENVQKNNKKKNK